MSGPSLAGGVESWPSPLSLHQAGFSEAQGGCWWCGGDHFSVSETEKRGKKRGKEGEKEEGKKEKKRGKRGFFLIGL